MATTPVLDITPELLERVRHGPVPVERDGRTVAVLVSPEEHEALQLARDEQATERWLERTLADPDGLARLRAEAQKALDSIERHGTVDGPTFMARLEAKYRGMARAR